MENASGLINGHEHPFEVPYPVFAKHIRIPLEWLIDYKFTGNEYLVLNVMMIFVNWQTFKCHPSHDLICDISGLYQQQVVRAIKGLCDKQYIKKGVLKDAKGKKGRPPNEYEILLPKLAKYHNDISFSH